MYIMLSCFNLIFNLIQYTICNNNTFQKIKPNHPFYLLLKKKKKQLYKLHYYLTLHYNKIYINNCILCFRFSPFFVEPMIVALDEDTLEPYMCDMDLIGCVNKSDNFVVGGTSSSQLYGLCEALWEPDMEEDQLFETISQALVSACNRDAISGWGAKVYIM